MAILCRVTRGELTESIHVAFAVVVDESGNVVYSTGDPNYLTCIRSCLKPFQAAAIIKSGAVNNFTSEELALMCSSHQGEEFHIKLANSMLDKLGFNDTDYECQTFRLMVNMRHENHIPFFHLQMYVFQQHD